MSDYTITEDCHERADNLLCQAQAITHLIMEGGTTDKPQISNAAWALFDMIERAREFYGKY